MICRNYFQLSNPTLSIPSSTWISYKLISCNRLVQSQDLIINNYFLQQGQISSHALKIESVSYRRIDGKNQLNMSTISSRRSSQLLFSCLLLDFRVQFSSINSQIAAKQLYEDINIIIIYFWIFFFYSFPIPHSLYSTLLSIDQINQQNLQSVSNLQHIIIKIMRHKYSKSVKNIPPQRIDLQDSPLKKRSSTSTIQLPLIRNLKTINVMKSVLQKYSQVKIGQQIENIDVLDPKKQQRNNKIIDDIRERSRLLKELKQKILELDDNTFTKRVLNEISYSSLGKIVIEIWENIQRFQNCNQNLLNKLEIKYGIPVGEDFIKSMNFINNICRFFLADYKKKMWINKQKQINGHFARLNNQMFEVGKKIQEIDSKSTKKEVVNTLSGIKQQCFAKKQCYLDWKSRAIEKLKQNKVHCQILRAQIFTEQFF